MTHHLIHIGYPKTGSTFLQEWFERHPAFVYKPGGLGGFYNAYELAQLSNAAPEYYVTSFEGLSTPHKSAGGLRLEPSVAESMEEDHIKENQASVCALLQSLYPGSRVLIMTRGFKAMIMSAYSQLVRMGTVRHPDEMCRDLSQRLQNDAFHYFDYDYLIDLYSQAFGEENLLILPYELLRDDQSQFLTTLQQMLDVEPVKIELGRVNESLSPQELYWYPVISRAVSGATSRLGSARSQRAYSWYVRGTLVNRFHHIIKVLQKLQPDKKITEADFPSDILKLCHGKATRLEGRPLYAPYAAEYLWQETGGI